MIDKFNSCLMRCVRLRAPLAIAMLALLSLKLLAAPSFGCQLLNPPAQPLSVESSLPVNQFLNDYWKRDLRNEAASKQLFQEANPGGEIALVAYAVNRIQQNKTREAKQVAERLTSEFPANLDGWMMLTWLNALENKYDIALVNMRAFKKQINARKKLPKPIEVEIFQRLGRLIGYMQGPVNGRVDKHIFQGTVTSLEKGLAPDVLQEFIASRDSVLKEYDAVLKTQAGKTQVELVKVKAKNDQEKINLEQQVQSIAQLENRLIPQRERIESQSNNEVSRLDSQAASMLRQINAVSADIQATQLNLQYLYADLASAINHQQQHGHFVSTVGLRNQIRNAEYSLSNFRITGNQLSFSLNGTRNQIVRTRNNASQQVRGLDKELKRLNGAKRRNMAKIAKIASGPELADGKRSAMKIEATALLTYDDLSAEVYRLELLDHVTTN
ncbi:MAG: hypothetical protein ACI87E_005268 [Mariniblastus sp.]|jgi:hypothetical protein